MKRDSKKKLVLDRDTVRNLSTDDLRGAAGAQTLGTCSALCSVDVCPDTQFVHGCHSSGWTR